MAFPGVVVLEDEGDARGAENREEQENHRWVLLSFQDHQRNVVAGTGFPDEGIDFL